MSRANTRTHNTHIHMCPPISRYRTTTLLYRYNVWHVCVSRLEAGIGATFDCRLPLDTVFRGCMCGHSHGFYHTIFAYVYSMTMCKWVCAYAQRVHLCNLNRLKFKATVNAGDAADIDTKHTRHKDTSNIRPSSLASYLFSYRYVRE